MANSTAAAPAVRPGSSRFPGWLPEVCGVAGLLGLLAYVLHVSWRRWPDPIVDSGPQWYAAWRVALGAPLFGDFQWNYGPLSAYANGLLFKIFGVSLSVLFTANLLIYGAILGLAYAAFRRAWGWLAACAACAVFISVFSFSALNAVGNYNYGSPYAHEATHGMLLLLLTLFAAAGWIRRISARGAFLLGTCGGLAAILKPEFMLACGVLGLAALALRFLQKEYLSIAEWALLAAGALWPTLAFTVGFATREPLAAAFAHAANAWWVIVVKPIGAAGFGAGMQQLAGFDHPWRNVWFELEYGLAALALVGSVWLIGRWIEAALPVFISWMLWRLHEPLAVGKTFPLLTTVIAVVIAWQLLRQWKNGGKLEPRIVMQFMLALAAGAMLARMALLSRIDHFGFFQAALAGMLASAFLIGTAARTVAAKAAGFVVLGSCCVPIATLSNQIHAEQTQPVGSETDRFYAFNQEDDPTGTLVDWSVKQLKPTPLDATVVVIPDGWITQISEGVSINFLARRDAPIPDVLPGTREETVVDRLQRAAPDYVVEISHHLPDPTAKPFGAPGGSGSLVQAWVNANYLPIAGWGEPFSGTKLKGARVLRRKEKTRSMQPITERVLSPQTTRTR